MDRAFREQVFGDPVLFDAAPVALAEAVGSGSGLGPESALEGEGERDELAGDEPVGAEAGVAMLVPEGNGGVA